MSQEPVLFMNYVTQPRDDNKGYHNAHTVCKDMQQQYNF